MTTNQQIKGQGGLYIWSKTHEEQVTTIRPAMANKRSGKEETRRG